MYPCKITLLSNGSELSSIICKALYHYKITLLSNHVLFNLLNSLALHPYKITLLSDYFMLTKRALCPYKLHYSQTQRIRDVTKDSLCTHTKLHHSQTIKPEPDGCEWLCTHTKLHYSQTTNLVSNIGNSFVPLQNYTTLKHIRPDPSTLVCFVPLQNYTTLKHQIFKKNGLRTICVIL